MKEGEYINFKTSRKAERIHDQVVEQVYEKKNFKYEISFVCVCVWRGRSKGRGEAAKVHRFSNWYQSRDETNDWMTDDYGSSLLQCSMLGQLQAALREIIQSFIFPQPMNSHWVFCNTYLLREVIRCVRLVSKHNSFTCNMADMTFSVTWLRSCDKRILPFLWLNNEDKSYTVQM